MSLRTALRSILLSHATAQGLLGQRIYPQRPQKGKLPMATLRQITCPQVESLAGPSGLEKPRWQLTIWGTTPDEAEAAYQAANDALNGWSGEIDGHQIHMVRRLTSVEFDEDPQQGQSVAERAIATDYEVSHST